MATKQGAKSKRFGSIGVTKGVNSPSSSTTSSSKQFHETSNDAQSSPASSSVRSKPQLFHPEVVPLEVKKVKENVTVTVRFRPLK
jgi:centromeric protein E